MGNCKSQETTIEAETKYVVSSKSLPEPADTSVIDLRKQVTPAIDQPSVKQEVVLTLDQNKQTEDNEFDQPQLNRIQLQEKNSGNENKYNSLNRLVPVNGWTGHSDPEFFRRRKEPIVIDDQLKTVQTTEGSFHELGSFAVIGQGAIGFKFLLNDDVDEIKFLFNTAEYEENSHPILHSISIENGWVVTDQRTKKELAHASKGLDGLPILDRGKSQTFWMSFDKENLLFQGGSGYMLTALKLVEFDFKAYIDPDGKMPFSKIKKEYLKRYGKLSTYSMWNPNEVIQNGNEVEKIISKYPVYRDLPPIVKDHNEITLENLDTRSAISIMELSPECQRLYANVAGANIKINPPDFPDFAQAIDYSIKYGRCKHRLQKKAQNDFKGASGSYDANQTYLRITLGSNLGDSPGIPYVMEIWPAGCYSPIHDHSEANAIIKVLHGSLTTRWFASLDGAQEEEDQDKIEPYDQAVLAEGDVTWLDDRQFQTHQLFNHNEGGTACITIQCYMYNDSDNRHYENFDYVGDDGNIYPFVPNSDWDYGTFKKMLKKEFSTYKKTVVPKPKWIKRDDL